MNVLQRKMFAAGDVATNSFVDPYDEFQPYELDFNIEPKGEGYVAIQRNPRGEVVKETPINLALSARRDPVEAFQVQTKNEGLRAVKEAGLGIAGLYGGRSLAMPLINRLSPMVTKAVTSNRFLNPFTSVKKPGVAVPGKKGFQSLDPTKLSSFNIGIKPGAKYGFLGALGFGGLTAAQTTEEEVAEELKKLEEKNSTKKQETKDKAAPDPYMGGISDEEIDAVIGADTDAVTEAMAKADYDAEYAQTVRDSITDFQDRYMDNKNMDRFLRNIGKSLVEEGRFTGIATGAVAAADERAAERILEAEREAEMDLLLAKEGGVDITDLGKIDTLEQEYLEFNQTAENNQKNADDVAKVISVLKTQGKNIFGVGNIISSNIKKIMGFVAGDPTLASQAGTIQDALQSENPREYVKTVLEIMKNREIRELLGESGRTISNLDRQIVDSIIGQLQDTKILSQDPKTIASKLEMLQEDQLKKARQNRELANAKARNLKIAGRDVAQLRIATAEAPESRIRIKI